MAKIFQVMRTRGLQPRLLYPTRLSIKTEGQISRFPDKRSLKEYTSTKSALARDAKGAAVSKGRKRERDRNSGMKKWQ